MITKEHLIKSIIDLPDKFSFEEILDRIIMLEKIEVGIEQSKKGQINTTDQAKKKLKRWLK